MTKTVIKPRLLFSNSEFIYVKQLNGSDWGSNQVLRPFSLLQTSTPSVPGKIHLVPAEGRWRWDLHNKGWDARRLA